MLHLQNSPPHFLSGPKKLDLIKSAAATRVFPHRVGEETGREKKYSPSPLFPSFSLLFPLEPCLSGEKLDLPSRSHEPKRGERKIPWLYARTTQFPEKKGKGKKGESPPFAVYFAICMRIRKKVFQSRFYFLPLSLFPLCVCGSADEEGRAKILAIFEEEERETNMREIVPRPEFTTLKNFFPSFSAREIPQPAVKKRKFRL